MSTVAQDGAASGSQVMHGSIPRPVPGPRGRRAQIQQHVAGRDDTPDASSKKPEPSTAADHDTKRESPRPSRLPTLGGRVQSIQHKAFQAKASAKSHLSTQRNTPCSHKPPPLSYDGAIDSDSEKGHIGQDVVTEGQRAAINHLHDESTEARSSQSKESPAQLQSLTGENEELLFASFAPLTLVDKPSTPEGQSQRPNTQHLTLSPAFVSSSDHGGHPKASKVVGAAKDHFPAAPHEGHEYPIEEDAPNEQSLSAAPASKNEFQDALEELESALKTALRLASQAAAQERQHRAEAIERLPGMNVRALGAGRPEAPHSLKTQLTYTRVKTKKRGRFWNSGKSAQEQPAASPEAQGAPQTGLQGFTLQIPPRTDSLPMAWPPSDENEHGPSEAPASLMHIATSPHQSLRARDRGILPMPPPKKK